MQTLFNILFAVVCVLTIAVSVGTTPTTFETHPEVLEQWRATLPPELDLHFINNARISDLPILAPERNSDTSRFAGRASP